ncbi:hypothetical protein L1887_31466 [Cichorium endivia]|nr:hypothetical protein L1887_31466 [Cichorium endivia]
MLLLNRKAHFVLCVICPGLKIAMRLMGAVIKGNQRDFKDLAPPDRSRGKTLISSCCMKKRVTGLGLETDTYSEYVFIGRKIRHTIHRI